MKRFKYDELVIFIAGKSGLTTASNFINFKHRHKAPSHSWHGLSVGQEEKRKPPAAHECFSRDGESIAEVKPAFETGRRKKHISLPPRLLRQMERQKNM